MSAEWAEAIAWTALVALYLLAGWFARAVWDQPRRRATERALEAARLELKALAEHTMARHKARSEAAVRGHATRRGRVKTAEELPRTFGVMEVQP
jgi:hypothetical protein